LKFVEYGSVQVVRNNPLVSRVVALAMLACVVAASIATASASAGPRDFALGRSTRTTKASDPWSWSARARAWTTSNAVLPTRLVKRGPTARLTRAQFLNALVKVQDLRAANQDSGGWWTDSTDSAPRSLMELDTPAPALKDAAAGSAQARAVSAGWFVARSGSFVPNAPITSNEAALAAASALGLRPAVRTLAAKLRTEIPGARVTVYQSAQAIVRTVGMRFNVLDPHDELELGPSQAMNVAHGAYMLHAAATADSWKVDEAQRLADTFDLPVLGPNQRRLLTTAVRQLGQPYIWGGETEGSQAEGHGGFDCSGFTIRVVNKSGVPASQIATINERTTYTQSAIPRARRIPRAKLQPGDAMFFGDKGPRSTPAQNYHAAVYMGNGWFIHSSGGNGGVAINQLDGGWWQGQFAWGRRALRHR
jgi:cell wall-associated NlpC family hydrolase